MKQLIGLMCWTGICQFCQLWLKCDVQGHPSADLKKNLSSNNLVVWECVLSNLERCWRPQDLTTVRGYRASVYRSQITSSACDPAVVAQMCSPITHLHPSCSLQVIDGKLAPYLSKVIKFASSHVFSCSLCREKGFICELCHNGQLLYPFQESSIKR